MRQWAQLAWSGRANLADPVPKLRKKRVVRAAVNARPVLVDFGGFATLNRGARMAHQRSRRTSCL